MRQRILVLTSSTGSGHDMRARAFAAWVAELYGASVNVRIETIIENGSWLGRFGVWVYNTIHRWAPRLHHLYFFIVEAFIASHARGVSFGGRYYRKLLREYRPDLVFSVHDSTNRGYFEDARKVLGEGVRCITYCGEFSGGYGYSRHWVNPASDRFYARTEAAREQAQRLGLPPSRTRVFHKLLSPEAFAPRLDEAGKAGLKEQLGLDPRRFTVFLATGGYGANHHIDFLNALVPLADTLNVIVVCGRNQAIFEKVGMWSRANGNVRLFFEGYSTRITDFLQISDAVVTRGGANTTMEALHFQCPILFSGLGGLMPQETCTVRYITAKGAALLVRRPSRLREILTRWSAFDADYLRVREQIRELDQDEDPCAFIREVVDLE